MAAFGKSFSFSGGPVSSAGGAQGSNLASTPFGGFGQTSTTTTGSLFGAPDDKRQRSGTIAGSIFGGQTPSITTSGPSGTANTGLFGNTQAASMGISGGSGSNLFGSAQRSNTIGPVTGGSGLFGNAHASGGDVNSGSNLFGNAQTSAVGSSGGGIFGGASMAGTAGTLGANPTVNTGGSLFGSNPTSQAAQTSTLFGAASANAQTGGTFTNQQQAQQLQQQQQQQQMQQQMQMQAPQQTSDIEELSKQLLRIKECWDPASSNFQFRHYFYNVVESGQAQLYQCPPNEDPILWQQAQSDNPDPSTLVPVVANGFDDLRKRVDSQSLQMQSYQERSSEIMEKLSSILQKHHSETVVRLSECRRRQADLSQRLLEFMKLLQLLRLRGQLLNPEEEVFRVRVEHLEKEMSRSGSLKQRLAELQDHTYRLQAASRRRRELLGRSGGGSAVDGYEVADETQLESVMKVLSEKQRGLARMTQIMSLGAQSIEKIEGAIEERYVELQKQKEAKERAQISKSLARPW